MPCEISGFRGEVVENYALRSRYAASSGNLPMFRDNLSVPSSGFKTEDETVGLSRNVDKEITTTCCVITSKSAVLR